MGNQCCSSVRYTEAQFNEIQTQKAIHGMIEQPYFNSIDNYSFSCGQNRVVIMKGNSQVSNKSVYEMCLLINDLFSVFEDQLHKLLVTENLISFFRNNPRQITNKLVVDSLVELFSEQYTYEKIIQIIEVSDGRANKSNLVANNQGYGFNQQFQKGMNQSYNQQNNDLKSKYSQIGYESINDQDQFGLPYHQSGYQDNIPAISNQVHQNQFSAQNSKEIIDFQPNPQDIHQIYEVNQFNDSNRQMQFDEVNQPSNQFLNEEEGQAQNYSNRVHNNPNTMYKSGFQSPSKQEDQKSIQNQLSQLQISSKRQPTVDQNIVQVLEFVANKMGSYQLEQTSQKDIWQIWRIFDTSTGFMNYHKKYNLLPYSKKAMSIYQKEATVLQLIEDSKLNITPRLMKYDAKNKEIKFEGGYCTLWEYSLELAKNQLRFSEKDLLYITLELVRMVQDLQKLSIYHGNIKPQNIVLIQTAEGKYQIRLINFENCVRSQKDIYPTAKTEGYYDLIHKFRLNSDIMSSQIYQIGRTILNIIIKQEFNTNQLHIRKNHPMITAEALKAYFKEYPVVINIILKMLRQPSNNSSNNASQYQNQAASKAASNLSERNREEGNQLSSASGEQTINALGILYTMQQLDRDLVQFREQIRSGQFQNFIHDVKNVVKMIGRRRVEMGAWDQSMTPDVFKRELMYVLSLQQYERGCELCNYLLNFKSSPNYNLIANNANNMNNNVNNANNNPNNINNNINSTSNLQQSPSGNINGTKVSPANNSNTNIHQYDLNNPNQIMQTIYLKKPVQIAPKLDLIKYRGYQHEFLIKAQQVLKHVFSSQLNDIILAYFQIKEELSMYYYSNSMLNEAIKELEDLVQEKKNLTGGDEVSISKSFMILGEIYLQAKNYDKSIKSLAQSLYYITKKSNNLMHFQVAQILISMAEVYSHQNDSLRSIQSAMIAYDVGSQTSPNSLFFAEICIQISSIYMRLYKDIGKAIPYFEQGIKIKIECFKDTFLNQYLDLNILEIGSYYEQIQNYAMANEYYEILLYIRIKRLPFKIISSPQVAQAHTLIGFVHEKMNQLDKAQENHQKALLMRKHLFGEINQEVADSMINLSMIQIRKGQYQEALKMQEQALKIKEKLMPDSAEVAQCINNLAILLETLGNFDSAITYHEKALVIKRKIYGEQSSSTATSYNNLALTYQNSGQHDKAIPLFKNALQIREKIDENSEEVISVLTNLQAIHMELKDYDQANQYKEKIMNIRKIINQKKQKRDLSKAREEQLIYRTINPSQTVLNQNLVLSNQLNQQSQLNLSKLPGNQQNKTEIYSQDVVFHNQDLQQQNQMNSQLHNSINLLNQNSHNQFQQQQSFFNQQTNYSSQIPQTANFFFSSNHINQNVQSDLNQNILPLQPNSVTFTELNHFNNNNGHQDQNLQNQQQQQQQQINLNNSTFNNDHQLQFQQGSIQLNQQNSQQNGINKQQQQSQVSKNKQYEQQNTTFNYNNNSQLISSQINNNNSQQQFQQGSMQFNNQGSEQNSFNQQYSQVNQNKQYEQQNTIFNNNNNNNNNNNSQQMQSQYNSNNSQQQPQSMQFNQQNSQQNSINQQQQQSQVIKNKSYNQQNTTFNHNINSQQIQSQINPLQQPDQHLQQIQQVQQQQQQNEYNNIFLQKSQNNQSSQNVGNPFNSQNQNLRNQPEQQFPQVNAQSQILQQNNTVPQQVGENMKFSNNNNNLQYQSNRPTQLQSTKDFNAIINRVE